MEQLTGDDRRHRGRGLILSTRAKLFGIIAIVILCSLIFYFIGYSAKGKSLLSHVQSELKYPPIKWETFLEPRTKCPTSYYGVPPLVLISLDGFRYDYLHRGVSPTLGNISLHGINAPFIYSMFPTKTLPNHFSIITGLYPESHGIIGNSMIDPVKGTKFSVKATEYLEPYWWQGEPIWVTAQKQGLRAASYFWIGSEAKIDGIRPYDYVKYNSKVPLEDRVDKVLEWLERPRDTRPNFITLYASEPDSTGHRFGPCSSEVNKKIVDVDEMINRLFSGLQDRGLLNCVNVIVLSDHGMTELSCNKLLKLEDYTSNLPPESKFGAYGQMRPDGNESTIEDYVKNLQCKNAHMRAYKVQDLPIRFHYANNPRIDPVFLDLDLGWTLAGNTKYFCSGGNHGYDNYYSDMRPFFVASGPSFKVNHTVEPFLNIELYELMCELLNITSSPNNGTRGSLHDLLRYPIDLGEREEYKAPETAVVPETAEEVKERTEAAQCSCTREYVQKNVDDTNIQAELFPFGIPHIRNDTSESNLLYNSEFASAYNVEYRMPLWSSFLLLRKANPMEVSPCWRGDARVPKESTARCSDYLNLTDKGIVQQPLFPLRFTNATYIEQASLVTNSVPKHVDHIKLIENTFYQMLHDWFRLRGPLHIVTGPAFNINHSGIKPTLDTVKNSTSNYGSLFLPTHYYFVITWCQEKSSLSNCSSTELDGAAFILPNFPVAYNCESSEALIKFHAARVADVEILTGIQFYTRLPIKDAIRLRTQIQQL